MLGIGVHAAFRRRVARLRAQAEARYARAGQPVRLRTSFRHRARSWPRRRRILVKLEVTASGVNLRFMATNRRGRAADLIAWHDARGEAENWIKELKRDLQADRLSCPRCRANAVRLQLHTLAHLLLAYFRRRVPAATALADASVGTLRVRLLKVGACARRTVREPWFPLASHWPGRDLLVTGHRALARAPCELRSHPPHRKSPARRGVSACCPQAPRNRSRPTPTAMRSHKPALGAPPMALLEGLPTLPAPNSSVYG